MLIDYFDRNFMRGCIPYTAIDRLVEEQSGHGTIITTKEQIKTSMEYTSLRRAYEEAILADMEIFIDEESDDV